MIAVNFQRNEGCGTTAEASLTRGKEVKMEDSSSFNPYSSASQITESQIPVPRDPFKRNKA